jgi:hypothetical protein
MCQQICKKQFGRSTSTEELYKNRRYITFIIKVLNKFEVNLSIYYKYKQI